MAAALCAEAGSCTLLTAASFQRDRARCVDLHEWYGVGRALRFIRLPVYRRQRQDVDGGILGGTFERFDLIAAVFARMLFPELTYCRSPRAAAWAASLGLRTVLESHVAPDEAKFRDVQQAVRNGVKGVVTISDALRDRYVRHGIPAERTLVWPDGVDLNSFTRLPPRDEIRADLGWPRDRIVATYCGHLYPDRGIESILSVARERPEILFVFVGGTPWDVARRRQESEGSSNVLFVGFVKNAQVPSYLRASDILLMPYSSSCRTAEWMSPLKMYEYMAAGRPIIATDLPAIRRVLRDQVTACLVRPDSPQALAAGMDRVLQDRQLGASLGVAAAKEVAGFSWQRRARAILDRYCRERETRR